MATDAESKVVFMGRKKGLFAVNVETQQQIDFWDLDDVEVISIQVAKLSHDVNIVSTIDEMGKHPSYNLLYFSKIKITY